MLLPFLPALLAVLAPSFPCGGWSPSASSESERKEPTRLILPPLNSSSFLKSFVKWDAFPTEFEEGRGEATRAADVATPSPKPSRSVPQQEQQPREEQACNISVQRQMLSSLLVRWSPLGFQCDLLLFSTSSPGGHAFFSAAFHRVVPPLLIEHVGLAAGGVQQDLRLCVGCSWARSRRVNGLRPGASNPAASVLPSASLYSWSTPDHGQYWQQGERLHFCCLDFSLEDLKGDSGWRMNRKPIESTLVACFMTLVIIVWSVAALIWPVPIIAGFLPNGMEQRRSAPAASK
ncbi:transmembrane protein 158 [Erythrolamprus reginae]|uniref:transmembrane protein 158 n=1 Tax=Erythrolamprus reginae TaxID=121349 RepID=UPI00396CEA5D